MRQSSLRQDERNTESGRRQYELRREAVALGWPEERIRVIDGDQGKSGASSEHRSGFRDLMARVAAGEVGLVLSLEVSRQARNSADWHQLLQVAALTDTLIPEDPQCSVRRVDSEHRPPYVHTMVAAIEVADGHGTVPPVMLVFVRP